MSERSDYKPGEFCWVDLATSDMDASVRFYGELMGWDLQELGNAEETHGYSNFTYGDKAVTGIGDADAAVATTTGSGGTNVFGPEEIPVGRLAVPVDPQGANFAIIQPDYPEER